MRRLYSKLCTSSDGLLGHKEVAQILRGIGVKVNASALKDIVTDVVGESAKISFEAFVVLMSRRYKQLSSHEEVNSLFKTLSSNGETITANDLLEFFSQNDEVLTLEDANRLISELELSDVASLSDFVQKM